MFLAICLLPLSCVPEPEVSRLEIESTVPEQDAIHPADVPLRVRFGAYLYPAVRWSGAAKIESGEIDHPIDAAYDPVDQSLVIK